MPGCSWFRTEPLEIKLCQRQCVLSVPAMMIKASARHSIQPVQVMMATAVITGSL